MVKGSVSPRNAHRLAAKISRYSLSLAPCRWWRDCVPAQAPSFEPRVPCRLTGEECSKATMPGPRIVPLLCSCRCRCRCRCFALAVALAVAIALALTVALALAATLVLPLLLPLPLPWPVLCLGLCFCVVPLPWLLLLLLPLFVIPNPAPPKPLRMSVRDLLFCFSAFLLFCFSAFLLFPKRNRASPSDECAWHQPASV
jgi:hypothetical protein